MITSISRWFSYCKSMQIPLSLGVHRCPTSFSAVDIWGYELLPDGRCKAFACSTGLGIGCKAAGEVEMVDEGGRRWTKVDEGGRRWTKVDELSVNCWNSKSMGYRCTIASSLKIDGLWKCLAIFMAGTLQVVSRSVGLQPSWQQRTSAPSATQVEQGWNHGKGGCLTWGQDGIQL